MTSTLFKCFAVAFTVTVASAQTRNINARLVYFKQSSDDPATLYCPSATEGEFTSCTPGSSVEVDQTICPVNAAGKIVFTKTAAADQVVSTASVPAGINEAILFFLKNPTSSGTPYQVLVVDESFKALPKGGSYICNLSRSPVRVSIGESKYELVPGKPVSAKRPEKRDAYNMASLQVVIKDGEAWSPVKNSILRFADTERYFIIPYFEDGTRPSVKIYKQVVSDKDKPQAP